MIGIRVLLGSNESKLELEGEDVATWRRRIGGGDVVPEVANMGGCEARRTKRHTVWGRVGRLANGNGGYPKKCSKERGFDEVFVAQQRQMVRD